MGIIAVIAIIQILYNLIKEGLEPTRKCGTDFDKYFRETQGMTPKQKEKALRSGRYDVPLKWQAGNVSQ